MDEANELKKKGAVSVVEHLDGEYISSYFAVPKPRSLGKSRPILNLKYFNKCAKQAVAELCQAQGKLWCAGF